MPLLVEIAAGALASALAGEDAEKALARVLRAHPELSNAERASVARWVLGSSCLRATLRHGLSTPDADATTLVDAYRRFVEAGEPPAVAWPSDPQARLCAEASLPDWLARLWIDELGFESARSLALAMNTPGPTMLRANTLRISREVLAEKLREESIETEPGRLAPDALRVLGRANLWGSKAWRAGLFEVQDEGSQLIVEACRAMPGERWLDLCAGAGGKTLGLAAALGGRGGIVACDVDARRLENLAARIFRAGASRIEIRKLDVGREGEVLGAERFDGVLIDAPCSELGTLRRHPDARWRIDPARISALPELQERLLALGSAHLKPGGKLVYATCTLRRAENEAVAQNMASRTLRPDVEGTDGFFIAAGE